MSVSEYDKQIDILKKIIARESNTQKAQPFIEVLKRFEEDKKTFHSAIIKPVKVNLFLRPDESLVGGNPEEIIKGTDNVYNRYLISDDSNYIFKFDPMRNTRQLGNSSYLGRGGLTAVFSILGVKVPSNSNIPKSELIIRMVNPGSINDIDNYIKKWEEDKLILPENIPDTYMYGDVIVDGKVIASYTIVKRYEDHTSIRNLTYLQKIALIHDLLQVLKRLWECKYIYRDLKFSNIGYDTDSFGNIKFIILDHDDITILHLDSPFLHSYEFAYGCSHVCAGTYPPLYIVNDVVTKSTDWRKRLDKLSVLGLADIITSMIYAGEGEKFFLSNFEYGDVDKYYYQIIHTMSKDTQYQDKLRKIKNLVNTSISTEDNEFFRKLLRQILQKDYNHIPSYATLLSEYEKYFKIVPGKYNKLCMASSGAKGGNRVKRFKLVHV